MGRADKTVEGYIKLMKKARRSEAEVSGIVKLEGERETSDPVWNKKSPDVVEFSFTLCEDVSLKLV